MSRVCLLQQQMLDNGIAALGTRQRLQMDEAGEAGVAAAPLLQESSQRQRSHHQGSNLFLNPTVCSSLMGPKCACEVDVVVPSHPKIISLKSLNHKSLCHFHFQRDITESKL